MSDNYYVTKYALSTGVLVIPRDKAEVFADGKAIQYGGWHDCAWRKDWHKTVEDAQARVAEMKVRRRKSLEKSIKDLDKPVKFKDYVE